MFNSIRPFLHSTLPRPPKAVSYQPLRDLPSNKSTQPSPSKGAEGWAETWARLTAGGAASGVGALACAGVALVAGKGAATAGCGPCTLGSDLVTQPATSINAMLTARL